MIGLEFVTGRYAKDMVPVGIRINREDYDRIAKYAAHIGVAKRVVFSYCVHQGLNNLAKELKNGKKR